MPSLERSSPERSHRPACLAPPSSSPSARSRIRLALAAAGPALGGAPAAEHPDRGEAPPRVAPRMAGAHERQLIAIVASELAPGETIERGFARKEQALAALFASFTPAEARVAHRQLAADAVGDPAARWYGRLVAARRARLLAFLADAPRRAALEVARAGRR